MLIAPFPDLCLFVPFYLFARLSVPLATQNFVGPTCCLEYLGIILDSENMIARLPQDKVQRICLFLEGMLHKSVSVPNWSFCNYWAT